MNEEQRSPVFKSWNHWYMVVLGALLLEILLFFLITTFFA